MVNRSGRQKSDYVDMFPEADGEFVQMRNSLCGTLVEERCGRELVRAVGVDSP